MSVAILLSARRRPRPRLALLLLTLLLIAASLVHLGLGARWIAPQTVLRALLEYDPRNFEQRIIIDLRLVRLAAALLTGAALGVAGLLLQTVIRNPLGEPHILGLNAGASLAVVATSAVFAGKCCKDNISIISFSDTGICLSILLSRQAAAISTQGTGSPIIVSPVSTVGK